MSTTTADRDLPQGSPEGKQSWDLWRSQVAGILRLELRKNILSGRALPLYLLAALPVGLLAIFAMLPLDDGAGMVVEELFAGIFRIYFLKVSIFLSTLVIFMQLFRGDVMDRSLHYYFLCPVRREVLVAAKFVAGLVATSIVLVISTALSFLLVHIPFAGLGVLTAVNVGHLLAYMGITLLACIGYGSIFMLAGLFFRNPVVPAMIFFLWELINPFLPALLKKISIIHYLLSLLPVPITAQVFEVLAPPTSPWVSVPGLALVSAAAIFLASLRIRRMEITYSDD